MNEFKFNCPGCDQPLVVETAWVGRQIQCPACQQMAVIPASPVAAPTPLPGLRLAGADQPGLPPTSAGPGVATEAFCTTCGNALAPGAGFCGACGAATGLGPPDVVRPRPVPPVSSTGLPENVAAGLSYLAGWVTGLIFLLLDKRPLVRFHAAQSLVTFGGLSFFWLIFSRVLAVVVSAHIQSAIRVNPTRVPDLGWLAYTGYASSAIGLLGLVLWIICLISAFQGGRYQVPIAGDIAERIARK
jgi:uncharacterized membrane protein